ncbi:MAG TPA: hydrogenase maturation protease [Fimbriiglobus sp.]|jgi:hydrogenase maturation protease
MNPRILVAGIGNIFFGDDAFGTEVARRLLGRPQPDGVRIVDFGIRGLDLTYALLEPYDSVILIDAVPRGGAPGSLYVIEPELSNGDSAAVDPHALDPWRVLHAARDMGGTIVKLLLVGCEPLTDPTDDMRMGMSEPVTRAVEEAIPLVESLIERLYAER